MKSVSPPPPFGTDQWVNPRILTSMAALGSAPRKSDIREIRAILCASGKGA
jgi:hypothetical protein